MNAQLVVDGVSVGHGGDPVVHDATLTVPDGAVLALVGPNGSGKSTLLKTLYRVLKPLRGDLLLGADDLLAMPHRDNARAVGVLTQDDAGGYDFTAWEAVMLGRSPHLGTLGRPGPADTAVVTDALDRTGCTAFADRPLSQLSGGERQRVLLARALAQQPRVLVLDEPTNHLDPRHQLGILRLARNLRVTVVAALHSLDLAAQYADLVAVLSAGRIVAVGPPAEVFTPHLLEAHFRVDGSIVADPVTGTPRVLLRELDAGRAAS
ncbi:ABC transporter ATP-binding protein [Pseudonocardia sp. NPDC049635]|uniref:ABC transporter ATP-binding protein n=1 Tax=Pseudonocardia sp. NPDC049635 TaxID=3155506 RepID=UPI00340CE007